MDRSVGTFFLKILKETVLLLYKYVYLHLEKYYYYYEEVFV